MGSTTTTNENIFCVCYTDPTSARKIYINYISDGRQATSVKLPRSMLFTAEAPMGFTMSVIAGVLPAEKQELAQSIRSSLKGWYGNRIPRIYLDEEHDKDLVMNVHIFKEHANALKKLADNEPSKMTFLKLVLTTIQSRVCELVNDPALATKTVSPQIGRVKGALKRATGRQANKDEICASLLVPTEAGGGGGGGGDTRRGSQRPARTTFRVGDCLAHLCLKDHTLDRAVYYKLVLSNHPAAVRLPKLMLDIGQLPAGEALKEANSSRVQAAERPIETAIRKSLYDYHDQQEPDVFVVQSNPKDLVVNVPFALEHAPHWDKSFIGPYIPSFVSATIHDYFLFHFLARSRAKGWQTNERFDPMPGAQLPAPGRRATDDEIYSLMLSETGTQTWQKVLFSEGEWHCGTFDDY